MTPWAPSPELLALVARARELRLLMYEESSRLDRDRLAGHVVSQYQYDKLFMAWTKAEREMRGAT